MDSCSVLLLVVVLQEPLKGALGSFVEASHTMSMYMRTSTSCMHTNTDLLLGAVWLNYTSKETMLSGCHLVFFNISL